MYAFLLRKRTHFSTAARQHVTQSNTILAVFEFLAGVHRRTYWTTTWSVLTAATRSPPNAAVPAWRLKMRTTRVRIPQGVTIACATLFRAKYHCATAAATTSWPSAKTNSDVQNQTKTR